MTIKSSLSIVLTLLCFTRVFSQLKLEPTPEEIKLAKEIKTSIGRETDKVAISKSVQTYSFNFDRTKQKVGVEKIVNQDYVGIENHTSIYLVEFYNEQSEINEFNVFNKKGKAVNAYVYDNYLPSDDYFYHDTRIKRTEIKFPLKGYKYKWNTEKVIKDIKYFTSIFFTGQYPIKEKVIRIEIPKWLNIEFKELNFEDYDITKTEELNENKNRVLTYTIKNLKSIKTESNKPGQSYNQPHLLVLPKSFNKNDKETVILKETKDLYAWYKSLVDQLEDEPEKLKDFVNQLIADKTKDEDKIKAIYYWVQDHIRYIAYEDGIAGFKPDESQNVYEKKYGDCKGMANLLKQMLVIAGFDAHLTWIGTDRISYDYSTPNLSVDNHMICTLNHNGKRYFLDGTQRYNTLGTYANRIQGRPVLIENGDDFILDNVPEGSFEDNLEELNVTYHLDGDNLKGKVVNNMQGESKIQFMYSYNKLRTDKKEEALNNYLTRHDKNLKVDHIETSDLLNRDIATNLSYDVSIANQVTQYDDEYYIDFDYFQEFAKIDLDERESDYLFSYKLNYSSQIELIIPTDLKVVEFPENIAYKSDNIDVSLNYKVEGNKFVYKKVFRFKNNRIGISEFEDWIKFSEKLKTNYNSQLTLKK